MVCLVVGDTNADLCATLECFPFEGDDTAITALGFHSGGMAANVAAAFARLGGSARLLSRIGIDSAVPIALRAVKEANVDLAFVQHDAVVATGLCLAAISPSGERTFFSYRGANVALEMPNVDLILQDVHFLHISGHALLDGNQRNTTLTLVDEAQKRGIGCSIDLCLPLIRKRSQEVRSLAPRFSAIFGNAQELRSLSVSLGFTGNDFESVEHSLTTLVNAGAKLVVAKLGAAGSRIASGLSRIDVPPFYVNAVDTTGAGDGFVAAFLFVLLQGGSSETAAQVGNVVGALVASRNGAAGACPTREEVFAALTAQRATKALDLFAPTAQGTHQ